MVKERKVGDFTFVFLLHATDVVAAVGGGGAMSFVEDGKRETSPLCLVSACARVGCVGCVVGDTVWRSGSVENAGSVRGSGERGARGAGVFDGGARAWWAVGGAERVACGVCEVLRVGVWVGARAARGSEHGAAVARETGPARGSGEGWLASSAVLRE